MRVLLLVIAFLFFSLPAQAKELTGYVQTADDDYPYPAPVESQQTERPTWIKASAFTNEQMVGHFGRSNQPARRIYSAGEEVTLQKSISHYWANGKYGNVRVWCFPVFGHPGNFFFYTPKDPSGPKGWLQDVGSHPGKPFWYYRFWLDQD